MKYKHVNILLSKEDAHLTSFQRYQIIHKNSELSLSAISSVPVHLLFIFKAIFLWTIENLVIYFIFEKYILQ